MKKTRVEYVATILLVAKRSGDTMNALSNNNVHGWDNEIPSFHDSRRTPSAAWRNDSVLDSSGQG